MKENEPLDIDDWSSYIWHCVGYRIAEEQDEIDAINNGINDKINSAINGFKKNVEALCWRGQHLGLGDLRNLIDKWFPDVKIEEKPKLVSKYKQMKIEKKYR